MGAFDQAARVAAEADPQAVVSRLLAGRGLDLRFREWLDTRALSLPGQGDRTADMVAALDDPADPARPWLLVLEFQSRPDPGKLETTLDEVGTFHARVRHGPDRAGRYRVSAGIVHLTGQPPAPILDMTFTDGSGTRHAPPFWNVAGDSASDALEAVAEGRATWGMMLWVPLMAGADDLALIARWQEMFAAFDAQGRVPAGSIRSVVVFAELADRVREWRRGMEGVQLTESEVVNEWIIEGVTRERREFVAEVLESKFADAVTDEVRHMVEIQDDGDLLRRWYRLALRSATLDDFLKGLRG